MSTCVYYISVYVYDCVYKSHTSPGDSYPSPVVASKLISVPSVCPVSSLLHSILLTAGRPFFLKYICDYLNPLLETLQWLPCAFRTNPTLAESRPLYHCRFISCNCPSLYWLHQTGHVWTIPLLSFIKY